MDDILVATKSLDEHFNILTEVFALIDQHKLKLKLSKCKLFMENINYLGYRVDSSGIRPNPENLEAVRGFPLPKNIRDVHSFLGLCSYFRKFIKNFAIIAKPLYELLKKDAVFIFDEPEKSAFNMLKSCLLSSWYIFTQRRDRTALRCKFARLWCDSSLTQRR